MSKLLTVFLIAVAGAGLGGAASAAPHRSPDGRAVQVYAAVIRQLVTVECGSASGPAFEAVYVLDGPVPGAGDAQLLLEDWRPSRPFAPRLVEALGAELEDLPPVTFVEDRATVVEGPEPGHVIDGGVLVTVDRIDRRHRRAEVPASCWVNGLAGQWLTYVLERVEGRWQVVGTTGPIAIS